MKQNKILLGGVVLVSVAGIAYALHGSSTYEVPPVVEVEEVKLTELEVLTQSIIDSEKFQKETMLRAKARAMYELSVKTQEEAVALSEEALSTYRMAMELENEWKLNQNTIEVIE